MDIRGTVVIGEGEKDQAPMLYFGEEVGNGMKPEVDVAVDPVMETRLRQRPAGALAVDGTGRAGSMWTSHVHYMEKIVVGRRARGVIDIEMPVEWNLIRIERRSIWTRGTSR